MPVTLHEGQQAQVPLFSIKTNREGDATVIAVSGELDLAAADQLDQAIRHAEESATAWIVVDLEDLSFMDSAILTVLLMARMRSRDNGNRLRLVRSRHDQVERLLSVTSTTKMFS
jgi:anti-sigma B factor antagonist